MAYMNQERKKELAPAIKAVLKKYSMKGTIAVRHHSTLVVNVKSGPIDFGEYTHGDGYIQINTYHTDSHYEGDAQAFLRELIDAMNAGNFDKSDAMTDYFHVGWYIDVNIGGWNKPYQYTGPAKPAAAKPRYRYVGGTWELVA